MKRAMLIFVLFFLNSGLLKADLDPQGQSIMGDPLLSETSEWPQTIHQDSKATSLPIEDVRIVGRMSRGLVQSWVNLRNRGLWFECGIRYESEEEKEEAATAWAFHIVHAARKRGINPWGLAGTIANESNFDRCAIGYHPRKWAVRKHMLKRKRRTISYSAEEIMAVYRSIAAKRRWRDTGWDAGPCQLLSKYYPGSIEDMFTLTRGIDICAMEMHSRQEMYRSNRGWRWWRGAETAWYDNKITRYARRIGARRDEI
jgi:hypothetical protein